MLNKKTTLAICTLSLLVLTNLIPEAQSASVPNVHPSDNKKILDRIETEVQNEVVTDESLAAIQKVVEEEPNNARARSLLGDCLDLSGLPDQAITQFKKAIDLSPNDPKPAVEMVKAYIKRGQVQAARALLGQVQTRFPNSPEILFWVGNFLASSNQMKDAKKLYDAAYQKGKNIPGLASALGKMELHDGHYADAILLADHDLAIDRNCAPAWEVKSLALMKMGRYSEAVPALTKAYSLRPLNQNLAFNYALALYWAGEYRQALLPALLYLSLNSTLSYSDLPSKQLVSKVISRVPTKELGRQIDQVMKSPYIGRNPACRFAFADVLDRRGLHDLAMQQYREGLSLSPRYGRAWFRLGLDEEVYSNDYDDALTCYKKATIFAPEDKQVSAHFTRLEDRLAGRKADVAWALKDNLKLQALFKD